MIRLWMYGIILCIGSALLTWNQTQYFVTNFGPGDNKSRQQHHRSSSSVGKKFPRAHVENKQTGKVDQSSSLEPEAEYSESRSADTADDDAPVNADAAAASKRANDDIVNQHGKKNAGAVVGKLADFHEPIDGTIQSISLLGERNSGTRWIYGYVVDHCSLATMLFCFFILVILMIVLLCRSSFKYHVNNYSHLGECFNHTIPVHRSLSRYKHWFQYDTPKIRKNTLVIAMFRDPMTWTWAMKEVPHHASDHLDLPWEEFVTKTWTMERLAKDEAWREYQLQTHNDTGRICQEHFRYHELVSCLTRPYPDGYWGPHRTHRFSQHQPFYEMKVNDPDGRPYPNILQMRADKIRNFVESGSYTNVKGFWHYQYENLLKTGTANLIKKVERATGVKRNPHTCTIYEPQDRRKREMDPAFFDYMIDHVDWEAEALIGYEKPMYTTAEIVESS
jgi:hypothetical protein